MGIILLEADLWWICGEKMSQTKGSNLPYTQLTNERFGSVSSLIIVDVPASVRIEVKATVRNRTPQLTDVISCDEGFPTTPDSVCNKYVV
jgi:hypothetical protein